MSMYYKRNSFEEPIPTDELEPGIVKYILCNH